MGVTVRSPNAEDADRMGEVHVAAWRMAYAGVMPADYLAALDKHRSAERWARNIADPAKGVTNLVAEVDGTIQAIATVGPFRDHKGIDDPSGELWMINVHPDAVGTGVATALHRRALDQLRSDGHHRAALWVVDDNPRARRFYEREGWSEDPVRKEDRFGDRTIAEVRYSISL